MTSDELFQEVVGSENPSLWEIYALWNASGMTAADVWVRVIFHIACDMVIGTTQGQPPKNRYKRIALVEETAEAVEMTIAAEIARAVDPDAFETDAAAGFVWTLY